MSERFNYHGPATIDGVEFPSVLLREDSEPGDFLRSWAGTTSFSAIAAPDGFDANMGHDGPIAVQLPHGRRGQVLVSHVNFDGQSWTLELEGTGPAPR